MPVVVMTVLLGGFATPVEAAAVAALYAFIMQLAQQTHTVEVWHAHI